MPGWKILKFRSFISKSKEGFVFIFDAEISEIVFEDILFQLFEPFFQDLLCPQIYYFSSTDLILSYEQMIKRKEYIYVHFLERVNLYLGNRSMTQKLKIGNIDNLAKGIDFNGTNLYIFSERQYVLYTKPLFEEMIKKKIQDIEKILSLKEEKYTQYFSEIETLKDNLDIMMLKEELRETLKEFQNKVSELEERAQRYSTAKVTLNHILKASGIKIRHINDLY